MSSIDSTNGIPLMGFGTMEHVDGSVAPDAMFQAVTHALETGFRHFDCAEMYQTQEFVGKAISESKVKREDLVVTSKLKGMPHGDYDSVKTRTQSMLNKMSLNRFDLLLMHWPGPEDADWSGSPEDLAKACHFQWFKDNVKQAWENMLRLKKEGLADRIGVSNFYPAHLTELLRLFPSDPPAANQINIDALNHESDFVQMMQTANIAVIAYRPVAFLPVYAMAADMGDNTASLLTSLTEKHGCTSSQQLILAWLISRNICVIPKSSALPHVQANYSALSQASSVPADALAELAAGSETIAMCGGVDEYAAALRAVAQAAAAATASEPAARTPTVSLVVSS